MLRERPCARLKGATSIDFHAHLAREDPNAPFFMRDLFDVEGYLEKQERAGIERTVLSFALEDKGEAMDEIKGEHDFLAGLLEQNPDRFSALAAVDPFGGVEALAEGERALELGFTGFCFPTSRAGRYPDSADAADAFALADEKGALVFLHPSAAPIEPERAGHRLVNAWVGRPYDTGICLSRHVSRRHARGLSEHPDGGRTFGGHAPDADRPPR